QGEKRPALPLADVVNRADVGVVESGSGARLPLEALQCGRIAGDILGNYLDGDDSFQARVPSPIDFAHPTRTQRTENFVRTQAGVGSERHRCRWTKFTSARRGAGSSIRRSFGVGDEILV